MIYYVTKNVKKIYFLLCDNIAKEKRSEEYARFDK